MTSKKLRIIKHQDLTILVLNDKLSLDVFLTNLSEILRLDTDTKRNFKNLLDADIEEKMNDVAQRKETLVQVLGVEKEDIIGVPFSTHNAELYALNNNIEYEIIEIE